MKESERAKERANEITKGYKHWFISRNTRIGDSVVIVVIVVEVVILVMPLRNIPELSPLLLLTALQSSPLLTDTIYAFFRN